MATIGALAQLIQGTLIGDPHYPIVGVSAISEASASDITFLLSSKYLKEASENKAGVVVTAKKLPQVLRQIVVKNPRKAMIQVLDFFFPRYQGYSSQAQVPIHPSAQIDRSVFIGAFSVVGENTCVAEGTHIANSVSIGAHCVIGKRCVIHPQVVLYDRTVLGDDVIVHAGTVIGSDGFGYFPQGETWEKIAQIGRVVVGDQVEIGANTCIDRGCLGDTVIGSGTKIDNLVHIAHNVTLGSDCMLTGQVGVMGSATVEDHVTVGGQAGISAVTVGHHTTIAAKAGVTKNTQPNTLVSGYPAWEHALELQKEALLRQMVKKAKGNK